MAKLSVEIVTPEKRLLSTQADEAIVPGAKGLFGVRPGHTPFLSLMEPGTLTLKDGTTTKHPPQRPVDVLKDLIGHGIPFPIAARAVARFYPPAKAWYSGG